MTPEVAAVLTRVSEELEVQLELLEREGVRYAERYAEYALSGRPGSGQPRKPQGMQGQIASLIRDLTMDELIVRRRGVA